MSINAGSFIGGVSVYIRKCFENMFTRIHHDWVDAMLFISKTPLFNSSKKSIVGFIYIAPKDSPIYKDKQNGIDELERKLITVSEEYPDAYFILAGDFNARIGHEHDFIDEDNIDYLPIDTSCYECDNSSMHRKSKDKIGNEFGKELLS